MVYAECPVAHRSSYLMLGVAPERASRLRAVTLMLGLRPEEGFSIDWELI